MAIMFVEINFLGLNLMRYETYVRYEHTRRIRIICIGLVSMVITLVLLRLYQTTQFRVVSDVAGDEEDFLKKVIAKGKALSSDGGPILLSLINSAFIPFTFSWLCNTVDMIGVHDKLLFITTDNGATEKMHSHWPNVNILQLPGLEVLSRDQEYNTQTYYRLIVERTLVIRNLLQADIEVLLFETDALWLMNPVPLFQTQDDVYDVIGIRVYERPHEVGGGFLYIRPTPRSKELWSELVRRLNANKLRIRESSNDQLTISHLLEKGHGGVKFKTFPLETMEDGMWYYRNIKNKKMQHPYVIQNNFIVGNQAKITRAKNAGHWFIDEHLQCNNTSVKHALKKGSGLIR